MNPIQKILELFRVKKTIRFHGTMNNLESILEAMEIKRMEKEEFYLKRMDEKQYRLQPTISLGTVQTSINGNLVRSEEITVSMNVHSKSNNLQEIRLLGSLHKFHVLIFFAGLCCFVVSIYALISFGQFEGLILITILWPVLHLWFNFVWTSQEKALIDEFKLALQIRIRAGIGT